MPSITIPPLGPPSLTGISPFEDALQYRSFTWAPEHGIATGTAGQRWLRGARFGSLAARVCPEFDPEALVDVVDWLVWLFAFDDQFCECAGRDAGPVAMTETFVRFLRVMGDPDAAGPEPFEKALADIWRRTVARATPIQLQRLQGAIDGYFFSLLWESCHSASNVTLADYTFMRPRTAGVPLWLLLVEILGGHRPEPLVMASADMVKLHEHAAHVINWMNDIFSFRREAAADADALNLAIVISAELGQAPQQALDTAAVMHADEVERFALAEEAVLRSVPPSVHAYVRSLRFVIGGFYTWFIESGRYY